MRPLFGLVLAAACAAPEQLAPGAADTHVVSLQAGDAGVLPSEPLPATAGVESLLPPLFHAPPPPERLDRVLTAEQGSWDLLGSNSTHVWVESLGSFYPDLGYSVVVDRATGCAVESYRKSVLLRDLNVAQNDLAHGVVDGATSDQTTLARLNRADTAADLQRVIGLAARFGRTNLETIAWNPRGPDVIVEGHRLYLARDGSSFRPLDDHEAMGAAITPDGRTVVYERCLSEHLFGPRRIPQCDERELVSRPLDGSSAPLRLARVAGAQNAGISGDGYAMLWRDGPTKACMQSVDVHDAHVEREACFVGSRFTTVANARQASWIRASPNGRYDAVLYLSMTGASQYAILDRAEQRVVRTLPAGWTFQSVGDRGEVVAVDDSMSRAYFMVPGRADVPLGEEESYDLESGRALSFALDKSTTLGKAACRLMHAYPVPRRGSGG